MYSVFSEIDGAVTLDTARGTNLTTVHTVFDYFPT